MSMGPDVGASRARFCGVVPTPRSVVTCGDEYKGSGKEFWPNWQAQLAGYGVLLGTSGRPPRKGSCKGS